MKEFILLMASLMSMVALSIDSMMPALGIMGQDLQVRFPNQVQFIIGFLFIGMTFGHLLWGPLSDSIGRKKVLYAGIAIFMVGNVICYLAEGVDLFLVGRIVQGFGVSAPYILSVAMVRDRFSGNQMARIMSLVLMIFILVPSVAPALGQGLLYIAPWRTLFIIYTAIAFGIFAWAYFRLPETLKPEDKIPFTFRDVMGGFAIVFRNRLAMCYTIAMGLCFGSIMIYLNSCQQIFTQIFQVGDMFVVYFGGLALVLGAASLINARIVETTDIRKICEFSTLAVILASIAFLILTLTVPVTLWMFLAFAAVIFFSFGMLFGNLNAIAMEPMGHVAGIAAAVIGAVSEALGMVIGSAGGQAYDGTLLPLAIGFVTLNIVTYIFMRLSRG